MIAPKILILLGSLLGSCSSQVNPFSPNSDLFLNSGLGLGGGDFLPEDSVPAVGVREQLIRRHHYLQYVRTVYTRLKEEYRRQYNLALSGLPSDFSEGGVLFPRQAKQEKDFKEMMELNIE